MWSMDCKMAKSGLCCIKRRIWAYNKGKEHWKEKLAGGWSKWRMSPVLCIAEKTETGTFIYPGKSDFRIDCPVSEFSFPVLFSWLWYFSLLLTLPAAIEPEYNTTALQETSHRRLSDGRKKMASLIKPYAIDNIWGSHCFFLIISYISSSAVVIRTFSSSCVPGLLLALI